MTDYLPQLTANWHTVQEQVAHACAQAQRPRSAVRIVAVTKYVEPTVAGHLHALGAIDLGESRPQELWRKAAALPATVRWHVIGHLQRNKVVRTVPLAHLVHSVDSARLLAAVAEATPAGAVTAVLLEVNASGETQKHGLPFTDVAELVQKAQSDYPQVRIQGLMAMAAYDADEATCRRTFAAVRELRDQVQTQTGVVLPELSMGMSGDFGAAIAEGATIVRIGSALFTGVPTQAL